MGTHPIFESDFDCLTENESDSASGIKKSLSSKGNKEHGGNARVENFNRFDKALDKFMGETVSFHTNMEAKWKVMGWASIGSFFMIHKILAEFHPLANPGGYWVPEPDLESDESRRKIESIKMSFALTEKQLAKRAAEVKAAEEASVVEKNPAESSQQAASS